MNEAIIIVEDEGLIAFDLRLRLLRAGYNVIKVFAKGEEVVEFIKDYKPSLVLMDVNLAGAIDGIETTRLIHMNDETIPVIFITGFMNEKFIERAVSVQSYANFSKPVIFSNLLKTIEGLLVK